ncbi:MAG: PTS sugar transporter subunit IIA [Hyphomonadaceae bacterium]
MGDLKDMILPSAVLPKLAAASKRQVIQTLVDAAAEAAGFDARWAFDAVLMRERLAGTGVGEGVAIPHARVPGLQRPMLAFARLEPAVDFDALDGRPADLVFLLLAPADKGADHLKALARVSRALRRADVRERLRSARGHDEIMSVFSLPAHSDAA